MANRMKKKIFSAFDPPGFEVRKHRMMIEVELLDRSQLAAHNSGRVMAQGMCAEALDKEDVAESDENTVDRWAACIIRVRDAQDKSAFADLFRHFAPRVKAFLMRSGTDASLAEECTQEVMAALWQKAHLFDPSRASAATWIFTIARNRKIDALRKLRRPEPQDLSWGPEETPDQAETLALQQESTQLAKAISSLPEKQRELIEKAYFGDLSHTEIAEETGLPLGTIKSRIRLALDRLRHAMK